MDEIIKLSVILIMCQLSSSISYPANCTQKDHLTCTLYKFSGDNCSYPFLLDKFSELYNETSDFPGTPHSFDASVDYNYEYNGKHYASTNLTFSPMQNVGIKYVKGFELSYYRSKSTTVNCFIFDLSAATWVGDIQDKMTVFKHRVGPLAPDTIYSFELYALPKPHPPELDDYKTLSISVPPSFTDDVSANWIATISYKKLETERKIEVSFNSPPEKFNFNQFYVKLKNMSSNKIVQSNLTDVMTFTYTDVDSGNYSILVQPYDPFWNDNANCLCKSATSCDVCITTVTKPFIMNSVAKTTPSPTTTTPKPTTETPQNLYAPPPNDSIAGLKVGLAVVGVLVGVILAVVIFFYLYRRRSEKSQNMMDDKGKKGEDNNGCIDNVSVITIDALKDGKMMYNNNLNANKIKFGQRLKLFLLYEEDHDAHRRVVNSFATYLQQHCQCDVMCVEWHLDTPWVHEDLNRADYIIIVNSEKAHSSYMEQFGRNSSNDPTKGRRSSSINSIRNKFLQEERYDNIVMVYFEYTDSKFLIPDICPGYKYKLLENFKEFLLHIHKIHRTDDLSQYDLPFDGNHNLRPLGRQLIDAIVAACQYENKAPQKTLKMLRSCSKISDPDSQLDSGLPEDLGSPGTTPCTEFKEMRWHSEEERQLLQLLENTSDAVTLSPSFIQQISQSSSKTAPDSSKPATLSPLLIGQQDYMPTTVTSSPPTASTADSEFDFLPPDDISDFDVVSRSQSEQMKCIVDRYQAINKGGNCNNPDPAFYRGSNSSNRNEHTEPLGKITESQQQQPGGYNPDADLHLLKMQDGNLILSVEDGDSVSLGGQSV